MGNRLTFALSIAVSVAIIMFTIKQLHGYKDALAQYKTTKNLQKESALVQPFIIVTMMVIISLILFVYGLKEDIDYFWIGLLLLIASLSEYLSISTRYILYYSDKDFFIDKRVVNYRNIKKYEYAKLLPKVGAVKIHLYTDGQPVIVPYKLCCFIQDKINSDKIKKKELKESRRQHAA